MPIKFNLRQYHFPGSVFIETGLWKCHGVEKALHAGFERIISIEIAPNIFRAGRKRLAKHISSGRVSLLLGNSAELMVTALAIVPDSRIVFWLDGHYQGAGPRTASPLYAELEAIGQHNRKDHTVLIDDRRLFSNPAWRVEETRIRGTLLELNSQYRFCYLRGHVKNDVLCAYVSRQEAEARI